MAGESQYLTTGRKPSAIVDAILVGDIVPSGGAGGNSLGSTTYEWLNAYLYDDGALFVGADQDIVVRHKAAVLNANTALPGVLIGTPITPALAANSLIIANATANGDILIAGNDGGHSRVALFFDASAPDTILYNVGGTWSAGATTWTIPAVTLGGNITGNAKLITNLTSVSFASAAESAIISIVDDSYVAIQGGTDANAGRIILSGKSRAGNVGEIQLNTPNAALSGTARLIVSGGVNTAVATWSAITHTGISVTSGGSITGAGAWSLATVTGALTLAPADANIQMTVPTTKSVNIGVSANFKRFYSEITLATDNAETDVGLTPAAVILSAAIRVSVEITGLDDAEHHIQLGINGNASKYIDVTQGASATTISVNKKGKYTFDPTTDTEAAALKLTITGGADQIPTAGKVYVEVIYLDSSNLADV